MKKKSFKIFRWLILPILAMTVFGLTHIFVRFPHIAENYYSQKIYPVLAQVISFFSRWFPFSLDDLFYFLLLLTGIVILILLVTKKISFKLSGLIALNVLAAVYILFYVLWGFNYFRADLNSRLGIMQQTADSEEFTAVFQQLVEATNNSYTSYDDFDRDETGRLIEDSYWKLAPVLKLNYPSGIRRAKHITLSGFFAQAGISGYFGPFFNEVHINKNLLPVEYAFVLAHEKAHQFGVTGEAEANFYAWLVCKYSESKQLQYSANLVALRYFMHQARHMPQFKEMVSGLDDRVKADLQKIRNHWMNLRNEKVESVASRVNDAYLKTNQIEGGIGDYTGVVRHVMDFSLDSAFQKRLHSSIHKN
jgi:Zn-dependent peptidase ImmA (M78 family)